MQVASVVGVTVALWATAVVPEYFTAILFFSFAVMLTGLTPKVVFSGFHSTAAWMIFGGLIIGVAVQSTGLGARMARVLLDRFGRSYLGLLFGGSSTFQVDSGPHLDRHGEQVRRGCRKPSASWVIVCACPTPCKDWPFGHRLRRLRS